MVQQTPLYDRHLQAGAKMVDFAGWDMPIHYGSQIEEHHQVRADAGIFDVSHMTIVDLHGTRVRDFLRYLLANDVDRLTQTGKALYSCMLNEHGGVIDDLIVYFMRPDWYRMVVNAATRNKDLAWINKQAKAFQVEVRERAELAMIAVQGPQARTKAEQALPEIAPSASLKPFFAVECGDLFVARTGYTGEDGLEIMVPGISTGRLWDALLAAGVKPIGLGARDTLRLEAGMSLYGQDMDEDTTPLESNLNWTIAWDPQDRNFIGRKALDAQRNDRNRLKLVGLLLEDRGVLRAHQRVVVPGIGEGETTSGSYSPTLGRSIALARVPADTGTQCQVDVRGKLLNARIVKPPFARFGKSCLD
jgi:aminomethyltransferase